MSFPVGLSGAFIWILSALKMPPLAAERALVNTGFPGLACRHQGMQIGKSEKIAAGQSKMILQPEQRLLQPVEIEIAARESPASQQ